MKFRELRADEIDCRVQTVTKKGFSILLYKDARCDMNILDETVGALNWKREHTRDNANCIVSIWDKEKQQWVSKEDTGTESFTEKEKGLASDSFKRACFNWGIGRELYTAPFIWINNTSYIYEEKDEKGKIKLKVKGGFVLNDIKIENYKIMALEIADTKGNVVFKTGVSIEKKDDAKEKAIKMITKNIKEEDDMFLETILKDMNKKHLGECEEAELKTIYMKLKERHVA